VKFHYYCDFNVMHIEDFFTDEEYYLMWAELMMLCQDEFLIDAKEAGGAVDSNNNMLRVNRGLPIESIMDEESSFIIRAMNKILEYDFTHRMMAYDIEFSSLTKNSTHLINHYKENQFYGFHKDKSSLTAITEFYKEPKPYSGGVLVLRNGEKTISPVLNTRDLIIFPGQLDHCVTPININDGFTNSNENARISVSRFMK